MKFRDGYWYIKTQFRDFHPTEIADRESSEQTLTLYTTTKKVTQRGDTLNSPILTLEFSSPLPDVIHIRMYHHKGGVSRKPAFELAPDGPGEIRIGETEETQVFSSGDLSAEITKSGPLKIAFTRRGKKLTELSCKHSGYFIDQDNRAYMVQYLNLSVGEAVYGLGERFTGLYPIR